MRHEPHAAAVRARSILDVDIEAIAGEPPAQPVRPFDDPQRIAAGVAETDLLHLVGVLQAIEIIVLDPAARALVGLQQREGRARDLDSGIVDEGTNQRARQRRLAGAQLAVERQRIAGPHRQGQQHRQTLDRRL